MKRFRGAILFLIILLLFTGCQNETTKPGPLSEAKTGAEADIKDNNEQRLVVFTSFYPMYDFAKKVGGDRIQLINMIPAGTEPHDWEPSPRTIAQLQEADVFIYHGAGFEHWTQKVLETLDNPDLLVVEAAAGVPLLTSDEGDQDSHVWLSIKRAKAEMENIKNALVSADPANAAVYEENFAAYSAKFDALDKTYMETLEAMPNKSIVVSHQAFGYLCADYGLTQESIEGLSAEYEPDPQRMAEIVEFAREHQVKTIFFEELVSSKAADAIAAELDIQTQILNPLEGLTQEQLDQGEDYLSVMEQNLQALATALQ
jgi:zinc transport system substrate-binding protein